MLRRSPGSCGTTREPALSAVTIADRIFAFTEAAAMAYGEIMSAAARQGRPMTAPDGNDRGHLRASTGGRRATRHLPHFATTTSLELICPWEF
jgi:hypothetical protein